MGDMLGPVVDKEPIKSSAFSRNGAAARRTTRPQNLVNPQPT
jgi:hypothetical protein